MEDKENHSLKKRTGIEKKLGMAAMLGILGVLVSIGIIGIQNNKKPYYKELESLNEVYYKQVHSAMNGCNSQLDYLKESHLKDLEELDKKYKK